MLCKVGIVINARDQINREKVGQVGKDTNSWFLKCNKTSKFGTPLNYNLKYLILIIGKLPTEAPFPNFQIVYNFRYSNKNLDIVYFLKLVYNGNQKNIPELKKII